MARILVIRGGAIGDFILTLPAIRLLKETLPEAEVEVLGYPGIMDLAVTAGVADGVRSLAHRMMAPLFVPGVEVAEEVAAYFRSFGLVVSYLYDPDGYFRGNLERLGVKTLIEGPHRVQPGDGPASVQLARPLERLALFLEKAAPEIWPVGVVGMAGSAIVLHPGSGSERKTWPLERWRAVVEAVKERWPQRRVMVVTGEAELERGQVAALAGWGGLIDEHWQGVALTELAARFRGLALGGGEGFFLGHDSGMSHLAAACGLRCVLLFGPTDPAVWAPLNEGVTVVQGPGEDLRGIPVEQVVAALPGWG